MRVVRNIELPRRRRRARDAREERIAEAPRIPHPSRVLLRRDDRRCIRIAQTEEAVEVLLRGEIRAPRSSAACAIGERAAIHCARRLRLMGEPRLGGIHDRCRRADPTMVGGGPRENDRCKRRDAARTTGARCAVAMHAPFAALLRKFDDAHANAGVGRVPMLRCERRGRTHRRKRQRRFHIFMIGAKQGSTLICGPGEREFARKQRQHVIVLTETLLLLCARQRIGIEARRNAVEQRVAP